jgi:antitoxin MazE
VVVNVVRIGNSRGIRIPKPILDQCDIGSQVSLEIEDGRIVLTPVEDQPRKGWDEQFKRMHEHQDDTLLIDDAIGLDAEDWEW